MTKDKIKDRFYILRLKFPVVLLLDTWRYRLDVNEIICYECTTEDNN